MIRGAILDIDGVLIGQKAEYNFPLPHTVVITALKRLAKRLTFVSFCTAKPTFAIRELVKLAGLHSIHIASGGAEVVDPIAGKAATVHSLLSYNARNILRLLKTNNIFTEVYAPDAYWIEQNAFSGVTDIHTQIVGRPPERVSTLEQLVSDHPITKIMPIAEGEKEKEHIQRLLKPLEKTCSISWAVHPVALPYQFCVMTAPGVTKATGAIELAKYYNIPLDDVLAVGDSTSDWEFIKHCGYAGAMANASNELKKLVATNPPGHFTIGGHVDENGVLKILRYFKL